MNKAYFNFIQYLQDVMLGLSLVLLVLLPVIFAYFSAAIPPDFYSFVFELSLIAVFLVMIVRPLADLFPGLTWLRPLVILRKGFGVFSASLVVSFILAKIMTQGLDYFGHFLNAAHWSLTNYAILSPLGDVSAFLLLVTSNKYSKRVLGSNWKLLQRLSYVYFYTGALYEYLVLNQMFALYFVLVVTVLTLGAFVYKRLPVLVLAS